MVDQYTELVELDDFQLENKEQDVRGHALRTYDGRELGIIQRMLVDPEREHVAALVLSNGHGIPVEDVEIRDGEVFIDPVEEARYFKPTNFRGSVSRGRVRVRSRT